MVTLNCHLLLFVIILLTAVWHIVLSPTITPHRFLPFLSRHTPTGSQGTSRLPPTDRLCGHHGSSILSKRRLGPCESFTFILSTLSPALFSPPSPTLFIDFITNLFILSNDGHQSGQNQSKTLLLDSRMSNLCGSGLAAESRVLVGISEKTDNSRNAKPRRETQME